VPPVDGLSDSRRLVFVRSGAFGGVLAHAVAHQIEPVGVMYEPVEDRVGNGRVSHHFVPVLYIDLTGQDRAAAPLSVIEDLQEVAALFRCHIGKPPVIVDQQLRAGDAFEQTHMAAIAARKRQRIEQPGTR
jgi:hypothetical protein